MEALPVAKFTVDKFTEEVTPTVSESFAMIDSNINTRTDMEPAKMDERITSENHSRIRDIL